MPYIHTDIFSLQTSKKPGMPCGDVIGFRHNTDATTIILADGLGSGIKANITAQMCVSRFLSLIDHGATLREAFSAIVTTMNSAWGRHEAFSVFSVARILSNGYTTVLSYDSPPPLIISQGIAKVLEDRVYTLEKAVICENIGRLEEGESLLLMSDGITQAGMGKGAVNGWESKGVASFINKTLKNEQLKGKNLLKLIHDQSKMISGNKHTDDASLMLAQNRRGVVVNLMSGTPLDKNADYKMVHDFVNTRGIKIICGGTTATIAAREMKQQLVANNDYKSPIAPPSYKLNSINLVTEGIVTLNQVYNLLDEECIENEDDSPVFELLELLNNADRINIFTGKSPNASGGNIVFKQQGILPRQMILQLIKQKMIEKGKLVVDYEY